MIRLRLAAVALSFAVVIPVGCGSPPSVKYARPQVLLSPSEAQTTWTQARQVFETRCVVCHGCYDAPCQLKLGTFEGIDRGASETKVYEASRLVAATPTRLGIDAHDTPEWRALKFHPVLPEGAHTDPRASLLMRMLDLKRQHPTPPASEIAASFSLELDRKQTCADSDHFDGYAKEHPLWGMPYALPGLQPDEEASLVKWVEGGAPAPPPVSVQPAVASALQSWEAFLNEDGLKNRLASRYIYEHLFLASLYFAGVDEHAFFRLVRSRTASGPVDEIPTRRPFDDPKVERVYYRFVVREERPLEKTHMPYPLGQERLHRFRELLVDPPYAVDHLPSYEPEVAANPFRAFQAIPAESRYRFMLEEAEFTLMGFIKGPVCRGQVALNVIEDRFWITFLRPDLPWMNEETAFLAGEKQDLDMPAGSGSSAFPTAWLRYGKEHERYVQKKAEFFQHVVAAEETKGVSLRMIWDGDGKNPNAALTVFRHFDSATVVKGLVGAPPKTAWVIDYPLLERIHYLLVAGFDVFGNVTHQVTTRMYMDFLRMEGEANFLMLLPPERRKELVESWYRGVSGEAKDRVAKDLLSFQSPLNLHYQSHEAERELFPQLEQHVARVLSKGWNIERGIDGPTQEALARLRKLKGRAASFLPELSYVQVSLGPTDGDPSMSFSITRDTAHSNVTELFHEDKRLLPEEDELTVVPGLLGAYPNAIFRMAKGDLEAFVEAIEKLDSPDAYHQLRTRFGLLRTDPSFWTRSDRLQEAHHKDLSLAAGLFDYSRLEAY